MSKNYVLTPSRRKVGKAVARGSKQALAAECLRDATTRKYLMQIIAVELDAEISSMFSDERNSILRQSSKESL